MFAFLLSTFVSSKDPEKLSLELVSANTIAQLSSAAWFYDNVNNALR